MAKHKNTQRTHAPAVSDPRFARAQHDPRFLRPKKEAFQVVLDDRFKDLLQTEGSSGVKAKGKGKVDKYGRRISEEQQKQSQIQQLKGLYRIEGQEGDEEEIDDSDSDDHDDEEDDDDDDAVQASKAATSFDYARGEGELLSSSDDDDTSDGEEDDLPEGEDDSYSSVDEDELEATTARPASISQRGAKSEEMRGERTRRIAIVNMDWDHIRARDLFMVFSSLVSPTAPKLNKGKTVVNSNPSTSKTSSLVTNGRVYSVRVYPSEFGRERMKKEDIEGPPRDIFKSVESQQASSSSSRRKRKGKKGKDGDDDDDDEEEITAKSIIQVDEGGDFDEEALRKYQLERLRYYYAVAEFDSTEAASHVYNEIDGTEMERSANVFDLRFIPDEMDFPPYPLSAAADENDPSKEDGWRDEFTQDSLDPSSTTGTASSKYRPLDFKTDALRHSRVKLTWDADDPERTRITKNIFAPSASAAAKKGGKKGKKNPNILTLDEMRDDDFRAYLASATEDEGEDEEGEEESSSRARFRALLNLDGPAGGAEAGSGSEDESSKPLNPLKAALANSSTAASVWGRSRAPNGQVQGEMEITFTPGLSEVKARKELKQKKKGADDDEEEETTLDKYVRKQREKKELRKARQADAGPNGAGEDGAEELGGGESLGFDDPFFAQGGDLDAEMEEALAAHDAGQVAPTLRSTQQKPKKLHQAGQDPDEQPARKSKTQAKREAKLERKRKRKLAKAGIVEDESKAGIDSDDDDEGATARAEQADFDVDVADPRFEAVLEDHRFAIDPSHKAWKETKGMRKLVDERRKKARRT